MMPVSPTTATIYDEDYDYTIEHSLEVICR